MKENESANNSHSQIRNDSLSVQQRQEIMTYGKLLTDEVRDSIIKVF